MNRKELIGKIVRIAKDELTGLKACEKIETLLKAEGVELIEVIIKK